MARIQYDRFLRDEYNLIVITNTDADTVEEITPESFTSPPLKLRFLKIPGSGFDQFCHDCFVHYNEDNPDFEIPDDVGAQMLRGELPEWRLISIGLTPDAGLHGYYVHESMAEKAKSGKCIDVGASVLFPDDIEVEVEVDYADGFPTRRYTCKVGDSDSGFATEVIEYLGKRKVKKLEYSEKESGDNEQGWLCHITEY